MQATYNTQDRIGSTRYVVNHHDGRKTHPDGSPFFDIATFTNRKQRDRFLATLRSRGYQEHR